MAEPKEHTRFEFSAGGVVYKKEEDGIYVVLIEPNKWDSPEGSGQWRLPKGLIEKKDSAESAALREVREEAGVTGEIEELLGEIKIFFKFKGENIVKNVKFFLMRHEEGEPEPDGFETHSAEWVEIDEAIGRLTYKNEREIVVKAKKLLV